MMLRTAAFVLALAAAAALPFVLPSNYAVNVATMILFAAFLGQAWNIAGGFAGQTSFGHVVFFGTGAYASTILQISWGWNPWLGWIAAAVAGGIVGLAIGVLAFRAGLRGSYFALITLAFAEVFRILANSVGFTRGGLGLLITADARAANMQFKDPRWFYWIALGLVLASLAIAWWLKRSRFGARLAAIRENEDAARALGIDTFREKTLCLGISGAMAGAGGTFYAQKYLYIDPTIAYGVEKSVEMLLVTMIGGAGTVFGPLVGSAVLGGVGELTRAYATGQGLSLVVYGAILIAIVAWLPDGLIGLFARRAKRRDGADA
jgi:branched-chain amino acid transport system permease protein